MKKQRIRFVLKTLSPAHVGCDEVYEPTGFAVDEEGACMVIFDPLAFIAALSDEDRLRFSEICKKGTIQSIIEIYKFLRNRPAEGRPVRICTGFASHYKNVLEVPPDRLKNELNKFKVERTAYCVSDQRPYIPGSAIKGALRTAYLNHLAESAPDYSADLKKLGQGDVVKRGKKERDAKAHRWLEEKLLGLDRFPDADKLSKDPFRLVKVSDFMPLGVSATKILYAVNRKKKPADRQARGPGQILESIEPGASFVGEIMVELSQSRQTTSHTIDLNILLESARSFFGGEKVREDKQLAGIGAQTPEGPKEGSLLLRVGRHSGAESVTIRKYRDIRIMPGKKESTSEDHATTLWLASESSKPNGNKDLSPFGWAVLTPLQPELEAHLHSEEKAFQKSRIQENHEKAEKQKELGLEKERARKLELEEKRRQEEKRVAEEKRKAEFQAMTPEERAIRELQDPMTEESRVYEIYRNLEEFAGQNKQKAAQLLKSYWQREQKWEKKNCSKKQWQKVVHIKGILGEK